MVKVNYRLVPVKAHYFFFMAAMGPILPYTVVFGKQLGISEVVMGSITAILPILFLVAKPAFGFLVDYFQRQRKMVFMILIAIMCGSHVLLYFVPPSSARSHTFSNISCGTITPCLSQQEQESNTFGFYDPANVPLNCSWLCYGNDAQNGSELMILTSQNHLNPPNSTPVCVMPTSSELLTHCEQYQEDECRLDCAVKDDNNDLYESVTFWSFVFLMSVGSIAYNVANSISDALCFDVLGEGGEMKYGQQRVFGAIGFGLSALLAGYVIDLWSVESSMKNYAPAFLLTLSFGAFDLLTCTKLKLPKLPQSQNILRDVGALLKHRRIVVFLAFATLAGVCDSFIMYFMFWYLEDLASLTGAMGHVKLIEGLVIAAETLGGEVIFFTYAGKILERLGYEHCLSLSFFFYALRLGLISLAPSPWWLLPTEFFLQGPSYALCYTTIVAYASAVAPPGTSATMQGLVAGMDDGFGYAVGSLAGGFLYRWVGGSMSFVVFSGLALCCAVLHFIIHKCCLVAPSKPTADRCSTDYKEVPQTISKKALEDVCKEGA